MSGRLRISIVIALVSFLAMAPVGTYPNAGGRVAAETGSNEEFSFTLDGYNRRFVVYVPSHVSRSAAVLLALHGGRGSASQFERSSRLDELAEALGLIVVYGEGTPLDRLSGFVWNAGSCCSPAVDDQRAVDDVAYVREVVRLVRETYDIDSDRIYATGMSNGAMMAHRLACEAADVISGIAAISGTIQIATCEPARAIPVLMMHGTEDDRVPYVGGIGSGLGNVFTEPIEDVFTQWASRNGCSDEVAIEAVAAPDDSGDAVDRFVATDCGAPVVLYRVTGGGHEWFGGIPRASQADEATTIVSAPDLIADFLDLS